MPARPRRQERASRRRRPDVPDRPGGNLRALLVALYGEFTGQQRTIADFLLANLDDALLLSLPELAERTGVSEATIVRFARRLDFSGFAELREHFLEILRLRMQENDSRGEVDIVFREEGPAAAVWRHEAENLSRTFDGLEAATFRRAAQLLFDAEHVFVFGLGISSILADLAHYWLVEIGLRVLVVSPRFTHPTEQLVAYGPRDMLLAFSFRPYSKPTIEIVQGLAGRGLGTVVVTDRVTSPAALQATVALVARTENVLYHNAIGGPAALLNALVTDIAIRLQGKSRDAFRHRLEAEVH